jgi:hypothetical protein
MLTFETNWVEILVQTQNTKNNTRQPTPAISSTHPRIMHKNRFNDSLNAQSSLFPSIARQPGVKPKSSKAPAISCVSARDNKTSHPFTGPV